MLDLTEQILPKLRSYRMPKLTKYPVGIFPHYHGYCLSNLPASICAWLGIDPIRRTFLSPEIHKHIQGSFQNVILLVVDGFRLNLAKAWLYEQLHNKQGKSLWSDLADEIVFTPLTSIVPSTTSAALTTLWTGLTPAEHGIIGYELFLKEFGVIFNMVFQSVASSIDNIGSLQTVAFDPGTFLSVHTLGPHFKANGVQPISFQHINITHSGLSRMLMPEVDNYAYHTPSELWLSLENLLTTNSSQKRYIYIYWGDIDTRSHHYGPDNTQIQEEWNAFGNLLRQFLIKQKLKHKKDTLFLLVADHGQIPTDIVMDFELVNHPELLNHLIMLPSGESRLPYLFVLPGHEKSLEEYINKSWNSTFKLVPSKLILDSGLLGNAEPCQGTVDRLGNWTVIPEGNAYWWWVNKKNHLLGRHGGLSEQEMLIPFISIIL